MCPPPETATRPGSRIAVRPGAVAYRWLTDGSPHQVGYRSCSECDRDPLGAAAGTAPGRVLVVDFGLLGPLTVSDGARPVAVSAPRQRVLLATLLLNAGRVVGVDTLAEVLWDGEPPAGARGAMHRRGPAAALGAGPARRGADRDAPAGVCAAAGRQRVRRARVRGAGGAGAGGGAGGRVGAGGRAAAGGAGAVAGGGAGRRALAAAAPAARLPRLEDLRLQVLGARIDADLALGRHGEVVAELRQLVAAHPLREHFHAQLMLGLYRSGRQGDALAAYRMCGACWPVSWASIRGRSWGAAAADPDRRSRPWPPRPARPGPGEAAAMWAPVRAPAAAGGGPGISPAAAPS